MIIRKIALVAMTMAVILCLVIPAAVPAQTVPHVDINVDQDTLKADISMGNAVLLRFSGNVTVSSSVANTVYLDAEVVGRGWEVTINPAAPTVIVGTGEVAFDGTVAVPVNAPDGDFELRVNATVETPGVPQPIVRSGKATIRVIVDRVQIEVQDPSVFTTQPKNVTQTFVFTFKVRNRGLTDDTFSFSLGDHTDLKAKGWLLDLLMDEERIKAEAFVFVNMNVTIPANAEPGDFEFAFMAESGRTDGSAEAKVHVKVVPAPVIKKPKDDAWSFLGMDYDQWFMVTIAVIGVCMVVVFFTGTEVGFFAFLVWVLVPLYCRIKKEKVLDNFTRGQIYGYIKANPGAHYMEVQNQLDITNGVLAHHLKVLEREEFIKVHRDGFYKRFYPRHVKVHRKGKHLSRLQKDLLEEVERHPGISQKMLSRYLGESKQVISYHIKVLSKADLVRVEKEGSVTCIYSTTSHRSRTRPDDDIDAVPDEEPVLEAEPVGDLPSLGRN